MKFVIIAEHAHDIYTGGAKREGKRGDKQKSMPPSYIKLRQLTRPIMSSLIICACSNLL